ncbi:Cell cycle checkpoint protein RAD1 [Nymphon striatum]|nr:Cell cycle checkpoint protein RAD1 [Nymphon striatum]
MILNYGFAEKSTFSWVHSGRGFAHSMSLLTEASQCNKNDVFTARTDNVKNVSQLLKAIHFKDSAIVSISANGLKVTVEDSKCVQANAFIQESIFQNFELHIETITFKVNLTVLLECLNIFGSGNLTGTAMEISYAGYGSPLVLLLEEGGVITDCSIKTLEPDDLVDFDFSTANITNKLIMKSDSLKETWSDLDMTSDTLEIFISSSKPNFRLSTFGNLGTIHVDYPQDSDIMESFESNQTQVNRYKLSLLKPSVKALNLSSKISFRTDENGFISMQYMIKTEDNHACFVEYFCAPDEDVEDQP